MQPGQVYSKDCDICLNITSSGGTLGSGSTAEDDQELNVKPEIEIFDTGMIYAAEHYVKTGVLKAPCHFQLILGAAGGVKGTVEDMVALVSRLPKDCTWAASGIGRSHVPIMMAAIAMGGHLRVGMEDNVFYQKGVPADSNAQFVARAKRLLEEAGLEAATLAEAREILGLVKNLFSPSKMVDEPPRRSPVSAPPGR
ncbi:MAG: 3-keto-5-aminohexanoate cleavage protein [Oscillospiraceae bacterium]|nr:3-keto-5-aminohexanoate cleavage protein [Oscillospiraceae bacterium]